MLKRCFLIIINLSNLPQSPGNGISETLNLKISSGLRPSLSATPPPIEKSFLRPCLVLLNCKQIVNFDILKRCFLTIRTFLSKLPPKSRKWHFRDSKFKNSLGPSALALSRPNQKELPTALHASVICLCVKYSYFCL